MGMMVGGPAQHTTRPPHLTEIRRGLVLRTHHHHEFEPGALAARKAGQRISVCLPARDEEPTVGAIVAAIRHELVDRHGLVDEVLVVDDHSSDRTAEVAEAAGARVVQAADVLPEHGSGHGKGEAMWKSLYASEGDLVVWCDADIRDFESHFVTGLLGPLLTTDAAFVKGFYDRPTDGAVGGGRVTELVARPIISLLHPDLSSVIQPLSGEYAGRRSVLERVPFVQGYGVEMGLLLDLADQVGVECMAQVDLGVRHHRHRPLDELSPQALAVLHTALSRAGVADPQQTLRLVRPGLATKDLEVGQRPPLVDLESYRALRRPA
jgi:glucosyl-3-phosphoglycerate synthase